MSADRAIQVCNVTSQMNHTVDAARLGLSGPEGCFIVKGQVGKRIG